MRIATEHFDHDRPVNCPLVLRMDPFHVRTKATWTWGEIAQGVCIVGCLLAAVGLWMWA